MFALNVFQNYHTYVDFTGDVRAPLYDSFKEFINKKADATVKCPKKYNKQTDLILLTKK